MTDLAAVERHPWNTSFAWQPPVPPFQVLFDEQAEQFSRDGYVVLESVFDPELIGQVTEEIDGIEAMIESYLRGQAEERVSIAEAGAITFSTHLVSRSRELRAFATHPTVTGLCADIIGPDVNLYWDQAVYKKPEKPRRFPWHQDNGYAFVEPQQYLTCWVALTDATTENGCPWVVPGVHQMGTLRHHYVDPLGWECFSDPNGAVPASVGAGGIVVFSSLTPHLTGPNATGDIRKAYILQYAPVGARKLTGNPDAGLPTSKETCDNPDRQFPVLRDGKPVGSNVGGASGEVDQ